MRNLLKPLSFLPALMLMYMIYSFSAQEGDVSSALSYKASYYIVKTADHVLEADLEEWEIQNLATRFHGVTRKLAHMLEYFALAIAVAFPLYVYGMHGLLLMLVAGFLCVAFACGDEYHQSFVAGRSPSRRDVAIDSFGIFWGIIIVRIIGWTGRKTIFRPVKKKKKNAPYRDASYHNAPYGDSSYNNASYGNSSYNNSPYGNSSYNNSPYGNSSYNNSPYVNSSYNNAPYGNSSYNNSPYGNSSYNNASCYGEPYYEDPYDQESPEEEHVSDKLSEDMSFRKLMHDIKDQRRRER